MGFQRNTVEPEQHKERSFKLFEKGGPQNQQDLEELFFLYNDVMLPREQGKGCGGCRARVWKRLKEFYGQ